jgi:hypothetical protein
MTVQRARRIMGERIVAAGRRIPDPLAKLLAEDGTVIAGSGLPLPVRAAEHGRPW